MRILIAEDDTIIADGLSRSLRQGGYAVDWAPNGMDADTALLTGSYDLLILDIGLPKLSGLEVLKRIRTRNSQLPVLILTALDGTGDRVKGLDLGADDYMVKPFELAELEARVRALTRRSAGSALRRLPPSPLVVWPRSTVKHLICPPAKSGSLKYCSAAWGAWSARISWLITFAVGEKRSATMRSRSMCTGFARKSRRVG